MRHFKTVMLAAMSASVLGAGITLTASPAAAGSADETRVAMVDDCLYSEWKYPGRRKKAATACKCAAKKAIGTLSKADASDTGWSGGLTSTQKAAWRDALKSCK
ncbi:MAG: hypothetical protein C0606_12815 [Hyphomicrobiales bacterium]|nr:MAG: hypothetical protein C0606_12815 [Hyphomicrobiales bacterium]